MNLTKYKRWRALLHRVIAKQIKRELILCVYMQCKSAKRWRAIMHRMITKRIKK